jgi:hypothetical protein
MLHEAPGNPPEGGLRQNVAIERASQGGPDPLLPGGSRICGAENVSNLLSDVFQLIAAIPNDKIPYTME